MKIKLIAPARKPEWDESFWELKTFVSLFGKKAAGPSLALPVLAALTPPGVEVVITDENIEKIDFEEKVDIVGISFMTSLAPRAYEIADIYRQKGIKVVLGGIHASMLPDEAIQHADSVIIGEAEETWPRLINDFKTGQHKQFYETSHYVNLSSAPIPRWDLIKHEAYNYFVVQTARGCPYECDFCSVQVFNGRTYRHRDIEKVIEELKLLKGLDAKKPIFFADDNLLAKPSYAKKLFKAMEPLNMRFWAQASINRLEDDEILEMLHKAGCNAVFIGFESVSQSSLNDFNKSHVNNVANFKKTIDKVHSAGILVFGSFVLGTDNDDEDIFDETASFINDTNIAFSILNILTPLPGTNLFKRLKEADRIINYDWQNYNCENLCIKLSSMNQKQFVDERKKLITKLYDYKMLNKRLNFLWGKGLLVRKNGRIITKGRLMATLSIIKANPRNWLFAIRSLWDKRNISIMSVFMSINCNDYANR